MNHSGPDGMRQPNDPLRTRKAARAIPGDRPPSLGSRSGAGRAAAAGEGAAAPAVGVGDVPSEPRRWRDEGGGGVLEQDDESVEVQNHGGSNRC